MVFRNFFRYKAFYFLAVISSSILFLSNKTGVPQAVTTAPGESGLSCNACHSQGLDFKTTVDITIMNLDSTVASTYEPGKKYIVKVQVAGVGAKSYGFQMVSLKALDNKDAGLWSSLGSRVKPITLLQRKYLEQSNTQDSGIFFTQWTAPTGGDVKFYAAGLAVNGNGNTNGDQVATTVKTISSAGIAGTADGQISYGVLSYNPSSHEITATTEVAEIAIYNNQGQLLMQTNDAFVNVSSLQLGMYYAKAFAQNGRQIGQIKPFIKF